MILVLGGTSDSLVICEALNKAKVPYKVSVTTEYGRSLANKLTSNVLVGALNLEAMKELMMNEAIKTLIDATHPYAAEVSLTAMKAAEELKRVYIRYERPSLLKEIEYEGLHVVNSNEEACELAKQLGERIFLGTGSKNLEFFWNHLAEKQLIARVLPTSKVIKSCEQIGFTADNIIAMKGPFTAEVNEALFKAYRSDLVITKESGQEGGFLEKIEACKKLGIPVIVIKRAAINYQQVVYSIEDLLEYVLEERRI